MLPRDASLSGLRGQLVVRTTRENLAELRRVLDTIDVAPRRLLVSVAQQSASDAAARGAAVSGSLRTDDHLRLTLPGTTASVRERDGVQARVFDTRSADDLRVVQTVQVPEGRSAYIQSATVAPVAQRQVVRSIVNGRVVDQVVEGVDYRQADTGFYVTPRVTGERVMLEVSPQRESFAPRAPGVVDVQRVVSTVGGCLGEWIEVASSSTERSGDNTVLLGRAGGARSQSQSVFLKVDELR
jgi:hypothetical protein